MDAKLLQQVFEELFPSLEALDTKCAAILQFLKNKGIASDEELAPYFEQAGNASSVRWRAARVRINHLLSTPQAEEKDKGKQPGEASEKSPEPTASKKSTEAEGEKPKKEEGRLQKTTDNAQTGSASSGEQKEEGRKDDQAPEREQKDRQSPEHDDKHAA
jgi:hypothetical protein